MAPAGTLARRRRLLGWCTAHPGGWVAGRGPGHGGPHHRREHSMQMDDMILVSIDDHMVGPPDMFKNHVPAKWADQAPKVVRNESGAEEWVFQGASTSTPFGMAATVGWPSDEWGFNPATMAELRPGCFDVHERVRDMNATCVQIEEHTSELQSLLRLSYAVYCL